MGGSEGGEWGVEGRGRYTHPGPGEPHKQTPPYSPPFPYSLPYPFLLFLSPHPISLLLHLPSPLPYILSILHLLTTSPPIPSYTVRLPYPPVHCFLPAHASDIHLLLHHLFTPHSNIPSFPTPLPLFHLLPLPFHFPLSSNPSPFFHISYPFMCLPSFSRSDSSLSLPSFLLSLPFSSRFLLLLLKEVSGSRGAFQYVIRFLTLPDYIVFFFIKDQEVTCCLLTC